MEQVDVSSFHITEVRRPHSAPNERWSGVWVGTSYTVPERGRGSVGTSLGADWIVHTHWYGCGTSRYLFFSHHPRPASQETTLLLWWLDTEIMVVFSYLSTFGQKLSYLSTFEPFFVPQNIRFLSPHVNWYLSTIDISAHTRFLHLSTFDQKLSYLSTLVVS